jgi:hypothetical protein
MVAARLMGDPWFAAAMVLLILLTLLLIEAWLVR